MNQYQQAYFKFMTQSREHVFYLYEHIALSDRCDTKINMFMAISSSSSIAAWVIWQKLSCVWAFIIACSQVITATKAYFPFKKRLATLYPLKNELERLCLEVEKDWYTVSKGEMTERDIHHRTSMFKAKKAEIEQKYLSNMVLPEKGPLLSKAIVRNKVYFENIL